MTTVYSNGKRGSGKLLKTLLLFILFGLASSPVYAQRLLTLKRDQITVSLIESDTVSESEFNRQADADLKILERVVYPRVPKDLLEKIKSYPMKIDFSLPPEKMKTLGDVFVAPDAGHPEILIGMFPAFFKNGLSRSRLVHVWFHALHYFAQQTRNQEEAPWVREGLAQLFVYFTSNSTAYPKLPGQGLVDSLKRSSTPLQYAFDVSKAANSEAYGHTFLYFLYLYKNCGRETLFWKMVRGAEGKTGEAMIDDVLQGTDAAKCGSFKNTALQAEIARFHNRMVPVDQPENQEQSDDRYLILNEFSDQQVITHSEKSNWKSAVPKLPAFQPMTLPASVYPALKAMKLGAEYEVFILQKEYPFRVMRELPASGKSIILLVKTK